MKHAEKLIKNQCTKVDNPHHEVFCSFCSAAQFGFDLAVAELRSEEARAVGLEGREFYNVPANNAWADWLNRDEKTEN